MKRRTLDFIFVIGGVALAALLFILGGVLKSNANFAKDYVKRELSDQKITFSEASDLESRQDWIDGLLPTFNNDQAAVDAFIKDNDLTAEADAKCLVKYAGQLMTKGKQAECYANNFIRLHATDSSVYAAGAWATDPAFVGDKPHPEWQKPQAWTYATFGDVRSALQNVVKVATANNDPKLPDYQKELDSVTAKRSTQQTAETLRGLLLTSYGFSVFGEKASLAATVSFLVAIVLLLASIAGLIHALTTPKSALVGHHNDQPATS